MDAFWMMLIAFVAFVAIGSFLARPQRRTRGTTSHRSGSA
jgi:preprotein translocase subunit YajC